MSADVILFSPRAEKDAKANLQDFILLCSEKLTAYGASLRFESDEWDISDYVTLKGMGKKRTRLRFYTHGSLLLPQPIGMGEPFKSFAKAYVRYSYSLKPVVSMGFTLTALRMLHEALAEGREFEPFRIDARVMNRAAQLALEKLEGSAYNVGSALEKIALFLDEHRLVSVPMNAWKNPLKRPTDRNRIGIEFDARRAEKMPTVAALNALPKIFRIADEKTFVLVSAITAILCAAPDRINEVLLLPVDCQVHDYDSSGNKVFGLRWWPAKGADPMVKWIVPSMRDVVIEALEKIAKVTFAARNVARWYEQNPQKVYLLPEYEYLRSKELLTNAEVGFMLFGKETDRSVINGWYKGANIVPQVIDGKFRYRYSDVEEYILSKIPRGFPWISHDHNLKYSDALFVVCKNEFATDKANWVGVIETVTVNQVNNRLGPKTGSAHLTIFDRYGFKEPDGSQIKVTTHQFRHYLNTLAQAGGMSQLDIAKWSGRKNIHQNSAYDHVSADDLVLKIRSALSDDCQVFGSLSEVSTRAVISRDEFARLKVPTAHATEFGACIHDYTMAPCQMHADCMNCPEQVCVKGDEVRDGRIRAELATAQENLAAAESADAAGDFGANRWVSHHRTTVERLRQLCAILDDPFVPHGSVIQLAALQPASRIEQAVATRQLLNDSQSTPRPAEAPEAMRNVLAMMMENVDD